MKLNCASCRYYSAKSCHRWPPIGFEDTAAPPHAIFPPVAVTDWCGEYAEPAEDSSEVDSATSKDGRYLTGEGAPVTHAGYFVSPPADKPRRGRPRRG